MSLWFAGYPKTPGCDVRFGSFASIPSCLRYVRLAANLGNVSSVLMTLVWMRFYGRWSVAIAAGVPRRRGYRLRAVGANLPLPFVESRGQRVKGPLAGLVDLDFFLTDASEQGGFG
jgi:hypothetical protein